MGMRAKGGILTPLRSSPPLGYTKEKPPHNVGSWFHDVWPRRLLVVCRGDVPWEGGRADVPIVLFGFCVCGGWSRWTSAGRVSMDMSPRERVEVLLHRDSSELVVVHRCSYHFLAEEPFLGRR